MNKIQKFALTLSIALAAALTFSCSSDSSDDDDDVGSGLSDLYTKQNQQVYDEDGEEFKGSGNVVMLLIDRKDISEHLIEMDFFWIADILLENSLADTISVGKIENGKMTLDLPKTIDSKFLHKVFEYYCEYYENCSNGLENALGVKLEIGINISDKGLCELRTKNYDETESARIIYLQEAGKIKIDDYVTYDYANQYDYNFSKGWNIAYYHYDIEADTHSTNPNIIKDKLERRLYCHSNQFTSF